MGEGLKCSQRYGLWSVGEICRLECLGTRPSSGNQRQALGNQSERSACMGSTDAARRAGRKAAMSPAIAAMLDTSANSRHWDYARRFRTACL